MKRWFIYVTLLAIIFNSVMPVCTFAEDNYAEAIFSDEYAYCENMSAALTNEIPPILETRDGVTGWMLNPENANKSYIRCDINDNFLYKLTKGETVYVDITYYDENLGGFSLYYETNGSRKSEFVHLDNTMQWKTHRFTLHDAYFGNGLKTNDFEIITNVDGEMGKSPYSVLIVAVKVIKADTISPFVITAESERYGNIFFDDEQIKINVCYESRTGKSYNVNAQYDIVSEAGEILYTLNSIPDTSIYTKDEIVLPKLPYGVYKLEATVSGNGVLQKKTILFSRSRKANEMNSQFGTNFHYDDTYYTKEEIKNLTDLMKNAGYSFVRSSLRWNQIEPQKGKYAIPENVRYANEYVDEIGMEMLAIVYSENSLYDSRPYYLPTEEALNAFSNYCYYVANELKDVTDYYCMLNEFNYLDGQPYDSTAEYFRIAKAGYEAITAGNPDAFINAGSLAGADRSYRTKLFDMGMLDYCDSFSEHYYATGSESEVDWLKLSGNKVRTQLDGLGKGTQTWVTEAGWPTKEISEENANTLLFVTEAQQAKYLARQLIMENDSSRTHKWFNYCFQDYEKKNYYNRNWSYGILHAPDYETPNAAKPSYIAISAFNDIIGNSKAYGNINKNFFGSDNKNGYVYKFENKNKEEIYALWKSSTQTGGSYTLSINKPYVEIYDMYGNSEIVKNNGSIKITFAETPVYVKGTERPPVVTQNGKEVNSVWYSEGGSINVSLVPYNSNNEEISVICALYEKGAVTKVLINKEKYNADEIISVFEIDDNLIYDDVRFFSFDSMDNIKPLCTERRIPYYEDNENILIRKVNDEFNISGYLPDKKASDEVIITVYRANTRKNELEDNYSSDYVLYTNIIKTNENGLYNVNISVEESEFIVIVSNKNYSQQKVYKAN